jgi:hypothetical protein
MSIIDSILEDARKELNLEKDANDNNGAPDQPSSSGGAGGQNIISAAQGLLQQIEQFKATLQAGAAGAAPNQDPNAQVDPNADPNAQIQGDPNAQVAGAGITVQTPGGSVVKIASLIKLSSLFSKKD